MYAKTKVRRGRKDVAEKLLDQLDILKYNNWPLEIYEKHRDIIEQLDPHKPREQTDEEKYTAYQAFKEALISYYTGIAINVIHKKAEGRTCYLDATAGIGILPLHIKNKPYPIFGSAIIPLITPTIGEQKFRRKPKPFKYVILAEEDKARRESLYKIVQDIKQRLNKLGFITPEIKYLDDINTRRNIAVSQLTKQCRYVLAVVDPTGAEIKWDTIKTILELRQQDVIVDVMFNFMCAALRRQREKACEETPSHAFDEFFGGNHWRQCCPKRRETTKDVAQKEDEKFGECLHNTYIQNIKNAGYAVYTTSIWKNQLWHYHFDLILKERGKPHPWIQSYKELSNWVSKIDETDLANIITGKLITEFM
jgi:three-Cys-motif partner protein